MRGNHHPVIAILLDAWDPAMMSRWLAEGHLPTLAALCAGSARVPLHGIHPFTGELPTHALLTATHPAKAGYWGAFSYDAANCRPAYVRAYDYQRVRNFYDYTPGLKVCQFDLPKAGMARVADGMQVLNWGAHGSLNPSASNPPELFDELVRTHGVHPALEQDNVEPWQTDELDALFAKLQEGVRRRTGVHRDLIARDTWNLFLTSYSEIHSAGHCYMHLDDAGYTLLDGERSGRHMLTLAREIDRSIADLLDAAPSDAGVAIFSTHGMIMNGWDINTMFFLPELLHRMAFPARIPPPERIPTQPTLPTIGDWYWADRVWEIAFGSARPKPNMADGINWIPGTWYVPDWPKMAAFALPGLDEGMVRLNVKGRDRYGRVAPAEYEAALAYIAGHVAGLKNARTGKPLVNRFFRTRTDPIADGTHLPPADLIVEWTDEPCDVADSPVFGRIGPVPLRRTGGHSRDGFAWFRHSAIQPGDRSPATPFDVGPTVLEMIGVSPPPHFDGRSLMSGGIARYDTPIFPAYVPPAENSFMQSHLSVEVR